MQVASDRVQARHRYLEQLLQNRRINRLRGILDELQCHGLVARQIISREPLGNDQERADFVVVDLLEG